MGTKAASLFRIWTIVTAVVMTLGAQAPSANSHDVISLQRDESILWIEASITPDEAATVTVEVKAPSADRSGTRLYQRCSFSYSGPGTYRCGIDTGSARQHPGRWKGMVDIDGARYAQRWFRVKK